MSTSDPYETEMLTVKNKQGSPNPFPSVCRHIQTAGDEDFKTFIKLS